MNRRLGLILLLIILLAAALRLGGIFDDFWLDEIWSYDIAKQLHNPTDVLLSPAARIDNNHPLNTFLLWVIGEQQHWWIYRLPSLLAGIGSVILATIISLRRGAVQAVLATALVGFSYPLIFYSSEARGYAQAVFFALLAFDAVDRYLAKPGWASAAVFGGACILGLLAHLTFANFYAGVLVWTVYRLLRSKPWREALLNFARLHLVPIAFSILLYFVFVRKMILGGSPSESILDALAGAIAGLVAAAPSVTSSLTIAAVAIGLFGWLCVELKRRGSDLWIFLLVAVVVFPLLVIGYQSATLPADQHQPVAARYFLVMLPFLFLTASFVLADLINKPLAKYVIGAALAGFFAISIYQTIEFLRIGRGHYSDAVIYMANHTPANQPVTVLADHPYRTGKVLAFYRRVLPDDRQMLIYDGTNRQLPHFEHGPPRWLILHTPIPHHPPTDRIEVPGISGLYVYQREFTFYGLSGYNWYLYERRAP